MKLNTFTKYPWSADLYLPVQVTDESYQYQFQRRVTFDLMGGMAQTYAYSKEPLEWAAILQDVKNEQGQKPYFVGGQDQKMWVTASSPTFDVYGRLTGYQQVLMRTEPIGWEKAAVAAKDEEAEVEE